MKPLNLSNMPEETEITTEDNIMLLKLIASLTAGNFRDELDGNEMIGVLDMIHGLGADIGVIWGSSLYISMDDYFCRVSLKDEELSDAIFEAVQDFSLWYLKQKTNEQA